MKNKNLQVRDLIKALISSEPCLFHNSEENLMLVNETIINIEEKYNE